MQVFFRLSIYLSTYFTFLIKVSNFYGHDGFESACIFCHGKIPVADFEKFSCFINMVYVAGRMLGTKTKDSLFMWDAINKKGEGEN